MPAKPSGEIKTHIVHSTQKNGDVYVYERRTVYDSTKKYNRVLRAYPTINIFQNHPKKHMGDENGKTNELSVMDNIR